MSEHDLISVIGYEPATRKVRAAALATDSEGIAEFVSQGMAIMSVTADQARSLLFETLPDTVPRSELEAAQQVLHECADKLLRQDSHIAELQAKAVPEELAKAIWENGYDNGHNDGLSCGHPLSGRCRHDSEKEWYDERQYGNIADILSAAPAPAASPVVPVDDGKLRAFLHDSMHEAYKKLRETGWREEYHAKLDALSSTLTDEVIRRFIPSADLSGGDAK